MMSRITLLFFSLISSILVRSVVADTQDCDGGCLAPYWPSRSLISIPPALYEAEDEHGEPQRIVPVPKDSVLTHLYKKFTSENSNRDAPQTCTGVVLAEGSPSIPIILEVYVLLALFFGVACLLLCLGKRRIKMNNSNQNETVAPKRKKKKNRKSNFDDVVDRYMVGKMFISRTEIAMGSDGTVVFEGGYEERLVAVKRLVASHASVAYKEIRLLTASDQHPNIVRLYGVENDSDFIYVALERCTCSLADLVQTCSARSPLSGYGVHIVNPLKGIDEDIQLWTPDCFPSTQLLKLMRDIVSGLAHLHKIGIVHRDLKPQNILITNERSLCAKLSDMGISKRLIGDSASLGHCPTGFGSPGWQAPEQLSNKRQTCAVDMFSLGCVIFFCISGGQHPYGEHFERDTNILKNDKVNLFVVDHIPEAIDLLSHLLVVSPESRLTAEDVMDHPLFWNSEARLSFLRDVSDWIEPDSTKAICDILVDLENAAPVAFGQNWGCKMDAAFLKDITWQRFYDFHSTRDLLRVVRNEFNHYRTLPKNIQGLVGPVPEGYYNYFSKRFPKFFIEVYKVIKIHCNKEAAFQKYFRGSSL